MGRKPTTNAPAPLKRKKKIHLAYEYPCLHCNYVEVACGEEVYDDDPRKHGWTMNEKKVTCKKCKEEII